MKTQNILVLALTFVLIGMCANTVIAAEDISNIVPVTDQTYENTIHTYTFMGNPETAVKTQRLLSGEHLLEVPAPEKPDAYFAGWSFKGEDRTIRFPYTVTDSDKKEVKVLPNYKKKNYIVKYMAEPVGEQNNYVIYTQCYEKGKNVTLNLKDADALPVKGVDKERVGWKTRAGDSVTETSTVTGDLVLYPVIEDVYWLTFDTGGGSFMMPKPYTCNEVIQTDTLEKPEKAGYTFQGWMCDGHHADGTIVLDASKTLKAVWAPAMAEVEVVIWKQNPKDSLKGMPDFGNLETSRSRYEDNTPYQIPESEKTYHYDKTVRIQEKTESHINLADIKTNSEVLNAISQKGFLENDIKTGLQGSVTVKGDGSTVYNIYLDRDIITYYVEYHSDTVTYAKSGAAGFYQRTAVSQEYIVYKGLYGAEFVWPDIKKGYEGEFFWLDTSGTFAGVTGNPIYYKYSYDFSKQDGSSQVWFERRKADSVAAILKYPLLIYNMVKMPDGRDKLQFVSTVMVSWKKPALKKGYYSLKYVFEDSIPGYHAERYELETNISGETSHKEGGNIPEGKTLERMLEKDAFDYKNPKNNKLVIYYTRNTYNVIFKDSVNGAIQKHQKKVPYPYMEKIKADENPASDLYGEIYSFEGFFEDGAGRKKYDFNQQMPNHDVVVYRVWKPKEVHVTFDPDGGVFENPDNAMLVLKAGEKISEGQVPKLKKRKGLMFGRWEKNGALFSFASPVTKDTVLKACWFGDVADVNIKYCNGEDSVLYPVKYSAGNKVELKTLDEVNKAWENDKNFIGWKSADGAMHYPGELVTVSGKKRVMTFNAAWEEKESAKVNFIVPGQEMKTIRISEEFLNTPVKVQTLVNKAQISLLQIVGWTLQKGTEQYIEENAKVFVNTLDQSKNNLYANVQKKSKLQILMTVKGHSMPENISSKMTIVLKTPEGKLFNGVLQVNNPDGTEGEICFTNGRAERNMKNGDTLTIKGYLKDYTFEVTTDRKGYTAQKKSGTVKTEFDPETCIYKGAKVQIEMTCLYYRLPSTGVPLGTWTYTMSGSALMFLALGIEYKRRKKQ